jgi:hypothetical protein
MAIDPMLYKKYSGRSGDPYERLGQALAQSAAQKQRNTTYRDDAVMAGRIGNYLKIRLIISALVALAVLGAFAWGLVF